MTIDYTTETIVTLGEACRAFPPNGVSDATMARFIQKGVKIKALGMFVKLETIKIGGRRFTSKEAISRFIAAQNADDAPAAPVITASQRRKQSEAAQAGLEKMGISGRVNRTKEELITTTEVVKDRDLHPAISPRPERSGARMSQG